MLNWSALVMGNGTLRNEECNRKWVKEGKLVEIDCVVSTRLSMRFAQHAWLVVQFFIFFNREHSQLVRDLLLQHWLLLFALMFPTSLMPFYLFKKNPLILILANAYTAYAIHVCRHTRIHVHRFGHHIHKDEKQQYILCRSVSQMSMREYAKYCLISAWREGKTSRA